MRTTNMAAALAVALAGAGAGTLAQDAPEMACWVRGDRSDLELRISPLDSASVELDAGRVKVCYGRPRKLGRPIMGRLVPYGEPWRLGANEATAIRMPVAGTIAGVSVDAGWYSLYVVPEASRWRIGVNGEARRWGIPIDAEVRSADVGAGVVEAVVASEPVEMMRIRLRRVSPGSAELEVAWDTTRVRFPVVLGGG